MSCFDGALFRLLTKMMWFRLTKSRWCDNDVLAALSAIMINADLLILLSTTNGLKATDSSGVQHTVSYLPRVTSDVLQHVNGKGSELSTGGMESKTDGSAEGGGNRDTCGNCGWPENRHCNGYCDR